MNPKRRVVVAIGVGLLAATLGVVAPWMRSLRPPLAAPTSGDRLASADGGTPVQRARIENYATRVGQEDFATPVENLNVHEDLLVGVGDWAQGAARANMFAVCLANRRLKACAARAL